MSRLAWGVSGVLAIARVATYVLAPGRLGLVERAGASLRRSPCSPLAARSGEAVAEARVRAETAASGPAEGARRSIAEQGPARREGMDSLGLVPAPLLVRACRRERVERTPVWFMRQAGRSLPEYREIRKRHDLFAVCRRPQLCAEVTLQPVRRYGVDAAVMFADIMLPVLGMGIDVDLVEGVGPVIERPIASLADVERLRVPDPREAVPFVLEAVRLVREELREDQALVGFCGGPFTVAAYLIEGKPTRDFVKTKRCMYAAPDVWHALMEKLADTFAGYVRAKAEAGADVVQLFDSWVGALSVEDYREFCAPYSARVLAAVDVPTIHFGTGTTHLLGDMAAVGGDVIGLDWRVPIERGWELVGDDRGVQGNLDPALLLGPWERTRAAALAILDAVDGRPGHVFNLGHGVLPDTDPDDLGRLVELVHERTRAEVPA